MQSDTGQWACKLIFKIRSLCSYNCNTDVNINGQNIPSKLNSFDSWSRYEVTLQVESSTYSWSCNQEHLLNVSICSPFLQLHIMTMHNDIRISNTLWQKAMNY